MNKFTIQKCFAISAGVGFIAIKLRENFFLEQRLQSRYYGTEVPTPYEKKILNLMALGAGSGKTYTLSRRYINALLGFDYFREDYAIQDSYYEDLKSAKVNQIVQCLKLLTMISFVRWNKVNLKIVQPNV